MGEAVWEKLKERQNVESVPYPDCLQGLNEKLKGIRYGEITLFTSGTGSGKSTVIKEIILDLLAKTSDKVGLISLEESVGDTAEKFISMQLKRNIMDPPPTSESELRSGYEAVFGDERLVLLDHQGSVGDASLIDKIEYMALMGCKYLVLDHITIAVSEGSEGLSGNEAIDKVMSDLLKVVKKHNVWLGLISHLRKAQGGKSFEEGNIASIDDIKGSGSIKQISFDIIAFSRNLVAESESERNTIKFKVLKSRFTGLTGPAGSATYNNKTTRLIASGGFDDYFTI
jgi:twinkle protein